MNCLNAIDCDVCGLVDIFIALPSTVLELMRLLHMITVAVGREDPLQ